jgi:hypothetical protein
MLDLQGLASIKQVLLKALHQPGQTLESNSRLSWEEALPIQPQWPVLLYGFLPGPPTNITYLLGPPLDINNY